MLAASRADRNGVGVVLGVWIGPPDEDIDETGTFEFLPLLVGKLSNSKGGTDFGEISLAVGRDLLVVLCVFQHRSPRFLRGLCRSESNCSGGATGKP